MSALVAGCDADVPGSAQLVLGSKLEAEKLKGATGLSVAIIGGSIGGLAAA
jgi:hypothetical protein